MIVIFNGPPGSGKDLCCEYLKTQGYNHIEFKSKLFEDCIEYYNVDKDWFFGGYDRLTKDKPEELLGGLSRREALINISENIIKPKLGSDYYGYVAANKMQIGENYCISDGGFIDELSHIINKFRDDILMIRLYRDNSDFNLDSRRYINFNDFVGECICGHSTNLSELNKQHFDKTINISGGIIHNNGNTEELCNAINTLIKEKNDRQNNNKQ